MKKLGLLIAPVLLALGCGGLDDVLGPADGGVCGGATVYALHSSAPYNVSSVSTVTTNCTYFDPVAAQTALNGSTKVLDNTSANGTPCFKNNTTPPTDWACMDVSCNAATGKSTTYSVDDGSCIYTQVVNVSGTVTGVSQMNISVSIQRSKFMSKTAGSCKQVQDCSVSYSAKLTGPAA